MKQSHKQTQMEKQRPCASKVIWNVSLLSMQTKIHVEYLQLVINTLFRISQNDAKEKLCIAGPVTLLINEF